MVVSNGKRLFNKITLKMIIKIRRLLKKSRHYLIICFFMFVFSSLLVWSDLSMEREDTSCLYLRDNENDSTPVLSKITNLPTKSIFFHVTCPGNITITQSCSIESTALAHSDWQINVVFSGPVSPTVTFAQLKTFKNIKFWRVHIREFTKNTPFEVYITLRALEKTRCGLKFSTEILKYLTLFQWGGIYLDLDMVVARPLGSLARNWASRHDSVTVGAGVLASRDPVGKNVTNLAITETITLLKSCCCEDIGSLVMTNALQSFCSTRDVAAMSSAICHGFEVYGSQFFHPIPLYQAHDYFIPGEILANHAYTYHLWNHVTKKYRVMKSSPYNKLAKRYCPQTFKLHSEQFGV